MKIIVDGFGADQGTQAIYDGCMMALEKHPNLSIHLIAPGEFKDKGADRLSIVTTENFISNDEEPAMAIRRKKDASIVIGARMMKDEGFDGLLSAGSTGGMLAAGLLINKRIPGISRAALTVLLPIPGEPTVLVDAGANMDCDPQLLYQFALMGNLYVKDVLGVQNPKVGLLNVGAEPGKGNAVTKEAYALMDGCAFNFVGNVEARDLLEHKAHVIVCDGFSGNIALKTLEGTAGYLMKNLKAGMLSSFRTKIGALFAKPVFQGLKDQMDYSHTGAQPLLGIQKPIFKAHGSSGPLAISNGIDKLVAFIEQDTIAKITAAFADLDQSKEGAHESI